MKIETCRCKKNVFFSKTGMHIFFKDEYYKYYIEDENCFWVKYDENGDVGRQGLRFFKKSTNYNFLFKEYFEYGRLLKLKKLEENV